MKIAAFGTMWNEESIRYFYNGFNEWAANTGNIVDFYVCYGRTDINDKFNWGEYMIFDLADANQYDGAVIIAANINQKQVRKRLISKIKEKGIPCVIVEDKVEGCSSISINQEMYMKQLVDHVIDVHGCTSFAYVGGPVSSVESKKRQDGFEKSLAEHGLTVDPVLIIEKNYSYNDGLAAATAIFESGAEIPDAVICANDDMATGVSDYFIERGYQIGRDIIITGFDGYYVGENYSPKLTTIKRPRNQMTYKACQMIADQVENGIREEHVEEKAEFIFSETCGCNQKRSQNQNIFRRSVFKRDNNRVMIYNLMNRMEERILAGEGLVDMITNVQHVLDKFSDGKCRINLVPDIEENFDQPLDNYKKCTKEYVYWLKGEKTVPEGHAFIYAPIHFLDHLYGYTIFRDVDPFMHDQQLFQFTKSIGFSIENTVQKKRYELLNAKLNDLYETDNLTGVYNRHGLTRHAEIFYKAHLKENRPIDVIFVDIDGLKYINDKWGHEAGDKAISIVGMVLKGTKSDECLVFRYGGDEFLVLRDNAFSVKAYEETINNNIKLLAERDNLGFKVEVSTGFITTGTSPNVPLSDWIAQADRQMYEEKVKHHAGK